MTSENPIPDDPQPGVLDLVSTQELIEEITKRCPSHLILTFIPIDQVGTYMGTPIINYENKAVISWESQQVRGIMYGEMLALLELIRKGD